MLCNSSSKAECFAREVEVFGKNKKPPRRLLPESFSFLLLLDNKWLVLIMLLPGPRHSIFQSSLRFCSPGLPSISLSPSVLSLPLPSFLCIHNSESITRIGAGAHPAMASHRENPFSMPSLTIASSPSCLIYAKSANKKNMMDMKFKITASLADFLMVYSEKSLKDSQLWENWGENEATTTKRRSSIVNSSLQSAGQKRRMQTDPVVQHDAEMGFLSLCIIFSSSRERARDTGDWLWVVPLMRNPSLMPHSPSIKLIIQLDFDRVSRLSLWFMSPISWGNLFAAHRLSALSFSTVANERDGETDTRCHMQSE